VFLSDLHLAVSNSSVPVRSVEEFEPEEGIDASFLEDTPSNINNTAPASLHDLSSDDSLAPLHCHSVLSVFIFRLPVILAEI